MFSVSSTIKASAKLPKPFLKAANSQKFFQNHDQSVLSLPKILSKLCPSIFFSNFCLSTSLKISPLKHKISTCQKSHRKVDLIFEKLTVLHSAAQLLNENKGQ